MTTDELEIDELEEGQAEAPPLGLWASLAGKAGQLLGGFSLHTFLRPPLRVLLCALLARGLIFGYLPFGLGFCAAMIQGGFGLSALLGLTLGGLWQGSSILQVGVGLSAALLAQCIVTVCDGLSLSRSRLFVPITMTACLAVCALPMLWLQSPQGLTAAVLLPYLAALALCLLSALLYSEILSAEPALSDGKRAALLLFFAGTLLLSLADLRLWLLSPARVLGLLLCLLTAYFYGGTVGAAVGVAVGAGFDLTCGGGAFFGCTYGLSALTAGLFYKQGRLYFALLALISGGLTALLGVDKPEFMALLLELLMACILLAALPERWLCALRGLLPSEERTVKAGARIRQAGTRYSGQAADALAALCTAVGSGVRQQQAGGAHNVRLVFDRASDKVCRSCARCATCWQRECNVTLDAFSAASAPMLKRGRLRPEDFPQHFSSACLHLPELIAAINQAFFALREQQALRRQRQQNASLLAQQYEGISQLVRGLSGGTQLSQPYLERQVQRYAVAFGGVSEVVATRDGAGRLCISLYGAGLDEIEAQGEGFAAGLSALLRVGLTLPQRVEDEQGLRLTLRERAPLRAVVGTGKRARLDAAVSGDSSSYFVTEQGIFCLLLSDGMGTGSGAAAQSSLLIRTVERFVRAGVSLEDTLAAVAPAMRLKNDGRRFATLDALTLDLFTGDGCVLKCGAAPSYLRLSGKWSRISGRGLPVGLCEQDELPEVIPLRFSHGDLFLALTDGICDGLSEDWLYALLQQHSTDSPKQLAARLALGGQQAGYEDDRTALVVRIERS